MNYRTLITGSIAIAIAAAALVALSPGVAGLSAALRFTARTSLAAFVLAWAWPALPALVPGIPPERAQVRRATWAALLAASHGIHAVCIIAYARTPGSYPIEAATVVFGGLGYAAIALFTASSVGVHRLRTPWITHVAAAYAALIFAVTLAGGIAEGPVLAYYPFLALLTLPPGLHVAAAIRARRRASS